MSHSTESFQTRKQEGYNGIYTNHKRNQPQQSSIAYQHPEPESSNTSDFQNDFFQISPKNTENFSDAVFNRPGKSQSYNKQFRGRFQNVSLKYQSYQNNCGEYAENSKNPSDCQEARENETASPNVSKMGQIVGGRYIRKHSNQSFVNSSRNNTYSKGAKTEGNTYKNCSQNSRRNFAHCDSSPEEQQNLSYDEKKYNFFQTPTVSSNAPKVIDCGNKNLLFERKSYKQYPQNRKNYFKEDSSFLEHNLSYNQRNYKPLQESASANAQRNSFHDSQNISGKKNCKQYYFQNDRNCYQYDSNPSESKSHTQEKEKQVQESTAPQKTFRHDDSETRNVVMLERKTKGYSEINRNSFSQHENQTSSSYNHRKDMSTRFSKSARNNIASERNFSKQYPQNSRNNYYQKDSSSVEHSPKDNSFKASSKSPYSLRNNDVKKFSNSSLNSGTYRNQYQSEMTEIKKSYLSSQLATSNCVNHAEKATQRELLIHHLNKGECECLVCCEHIKTKDQVWHCLSCYHVFHLRCIKKWARSPAAAVEDGSWRCPACQSLTSKIPFDYYCFCGKNKNPEVNYHLTPHTCGENCNRVRPECSHHCKELCHPGPCPPCVVVVSKTCPCGKTRQSLPCNQTMEGNCQEICDKVLNCGLHRCKRNCHEGDCDLCKETVLQKCFCTKSEQVVPCAAETASCHVYSCKKTCEKGLSCHNHTCQAVCHPGDCKPCLRSTEIVDRCPCGKSSQAYLMSGMAKKRVSCLDTIPVCGQVCGKKLHCGPKDNSHTCQSLCHEGECPACPLSTSMKCSCGAFTKDFPCAELTKSFIYTCEKRCNRRKDCGRHKCLNNCCTNFEHHCELVCNKKLSCSQHQCQETCHMGNCPPCWNVSFDELRCYCGMAVFYPPIHCGTKPPECAQPCTRDHPCEHDVKHACHSDDQCPPCTALTTKWCYGNHKQCGPVMCFLEGVSCGMPCQKPLPCSRHKCKSSCHAGVCLKDVDKCMQPCSTLRPTCGHACGLPCHENVCPESNCKTQVTLNCPCGHRSETTTCYESAKSYRLLSSTILATKMQEIKDGQCVNLNDMLGKKSKNNRLQCNEECAVIERNKRLAIALQIQNPDLSCSPGPPSYSEFLKDETRKSPLFVNDVYEKITNLVQLAKQSKQKCRSHSFPSMNRDQRRVVHELAEFFGCETQSYDEEPKKNVVVTAYKSKCWLPFTSIMTIVQRDMGIRKGPTPLLSQSKSSSAANSGTATCTTPKKKIDYFDYNE